jgi:Na+-transporting NADH:ubiquinone oxidoreductase subunit NqrC
VEKDLFDSVTGNRKSKRTTNYTELEDTTLVVPAMVVVVVLALVLVVPTLVVVVLILLDPTQSNTCVQDHMGLN